MSGLEFTKMSASGNDFILIDNRSGVLYKTYSNINEFVKKVCRRCHSVGADGLILIETSNNADFSWKFFNADGSEAEMCGNGGRCAARFAFTNGITAENMAFETLSLIHISEPTRLLSISYAVFCLKKKKTQTDRASSKT